MHKAERQPPLTHQYRHVGVPESKQTRTRQPQPNPQHASSLRQGFPALTRVLIFTFKNT